MHGNPILTSANVYLSVTNFAGATPIQQLTGLPLGTADGTATGEICVKVVGLGSALPAGAATAAKQDTGNTSLASIDTKLTAPLQVAGARGALTDRSSTITLGGTAQQAAAANSARQYLMFQNLSDTVMYISTTGTAAAAAGSILCAANGGGFVWESNFISTGALSVFCATTGKSYTSKEG